VTTNYLVWSIIEPSHWLLFGAVLTVLCWRRRLGRWFALATAVLVIVLGVVPTGAWLMRPLETRFPEPNVTGDVTGVIVLAGSERITISELHSVPQLNSAGNRLTSFLVLAARYPQAQLVYTGTAREGQVAGSLLLGAGVAPGRIRFEDQSRNTCDSAQKTRARVDPRPGQRWLLVTSAFHMPRSVACFRAAGWDVTPYPTDFRRGPSAWHFGLVDNLGDLDIAAHEWLGLVYYRLRGFTHELFPAPRTL
jgi:uncharacterized SAM-binding protein YcdF (DUF218 family)